MNGDININATPLSALTYRSRIVLSSLLNPIKVLPNDSVDKLPRDWRGLAALVKIPSESLSENAQCQDKAAKVLEIWQHKDGATTTDPPTLGNLIKYLQIIDRYDICDDLEQLSRQGQLLERTQVEIVPACLPSPDHTHTQSSWIITNDDVRYGCPQQYDAYILYAKEDQDFVDEVCSRMRQQGFKLCTEDDVLPGFHSQYGPISQLISTRCSRIILVCSQDFFRSPANNFFSDYAQAHGIGSNVNNIIPCVYKSCSLPANLAFITKLYYPQPGEKPAYDFWQRLSGTLQAIHVNRAILPSSTSAVRITEMPSSVSNTNLRKDFLALPDRVPSTSQSTTSLNTESTTMAETRSLTDLSRSSEGKKNKTMSKLKKFFTTKKRKNKKVLFTEG